MLSSVLRSKRAVQIIFARGGSNEKNMKANGGSQQNEVAQSVKRKYDRQGIPRQGQPRAKAIEGAQLAIRKVLIIGKE